MQLLNIRLSAIDESSFTIYARSDAGQAEYKSSLPFFETKTKWRTTLIKILEVIKFAPDRFSDEELAWMGQAGLLLADGSVLCADYLEKIGQAFYKAMFPEGEVRYLLERSLALAEQESNPQLHIQIEFNAGVTELNRLPDYPWEIVHDGQRFLAHYNVTFSRYIAHLSAPPKFSPVSPINVLLVSSGASDKVNGLAPLPERERKAVKKGLEKSQSDGHIRFSKLETASFKALETYLTENRGSNAPHILHFDGHGVFGKRCQSSECRTFSSNLKLEKCPKCQTALPSSQGYLLFEPDDDNNELEANYISAAELGSLLQSIRHGDTEAQQGGVRLAVLSACKSAYALGGNSVFNGVAQSLIGHGVPAVVAMQYTVSTSAATAFAERFYRELGNKQPLTVATSQGRVAMQNVEHNQWYRLIFYLRGQSNDGGQLFANSVEDVSHVRQTAKRLEIIPTEKLEKMYRESIAWCKARFRAVIGDEQKAEELANDFLLGLPPENLDLKAQGFFILTGDFGVGKTLIVQRIFQNAVKAALGNLNAQIPVYLHTNNWRQNKPLRAIIEDEADTLGDIKTQGAIVIIDELDKAPVNEAFEIVKQSDFLTEIWQKTTIIITSRPIQNIEDTYENNLIQIPPLSFEQAHHLIESISGQEVNPMRLRDLGASVEGVITYPLFALLLGRYWREGESRPISTRAELLSNLVDDSLLQAGKSHDVYKQYLIKLAVRCIEFGNKSVPLADIDLSKSEQQALLDSKLVVRQSGGITFSLSIFTQWFAYLALEDNPLQIEKYLQDPEEIENWRYALIEPIWYLRKSKKRGQTWNIAAA